MATHAVAGNIVVIEVRRNPRECSVAVVAGVAAGNVIGRLAGYNGVVVATGTLPQYLGVIDLCNRSEADRRVTVLAETGRRDVQRIFACRTDTIVATDTARYDPRMIEEHRKPAGRTMATITLLQCRRMIRWLALALHIVVAARAATEDCIVIHFGERKPLGRPVTVLAKIRAQHVICRLRSGPVDTAAGHVTADAFGRRTLKYGAHVAAFAIGGEVSAFQSEPGSQMVELRICRLRRRDPRQASGNDEQEYQARHHCNIRSSANDVMR